MDSTRSGGVIVSSPLDRPVATWTAADLNWLIKNQQPESDRLDYKQASEPTSEQGPFSTERQRREVAKDVSSFANTSGGRIVIGIAEHRSEKDAPTGVPETFDPLPSSDGGVGDRLIGAVHSLCRPPLSLYPNPIVVREDGAFCLVIEIPESITPVMLQGKDENRYYWRQGRASVPMTEQQVRERYDRMITASQAVESLIDAAGVLEHPKGAPGFDCAWFTLLVVPAWGSLEIFDPSETTVPAELATLTEDPKTTGFRWFHSRVPTHFGLEYRLPQKDGRLRFGLRLHRTGLIELHLVQYGPTGLRHESAGPSSNICADELARCFLDGFHVARGLYETEGYSGEVEIRANVGGVSGFLADSKPIQAGAGFTTSRRSSVPTLREDSVPFVQSLLNRIWNAAGWERFNWRDGWPDAGPVFGLMG
jgi:hypothetical protein